MAGDTSVHPVGEPDPSDSSQRGERAALPDRDDSASRPRSTAAFSSAMSYLSGVARITPLQLPEEPTSEPQQPLQALEQVDGLGEGFGKYRIQGRIARGGGGVIVKARDVDINRDVAIKLLSEDLVHDQAYLQRFIEEVQIGGQLQHPGIVPVYEFGVCEGRPYLAMKLIKGRTLGHMLKKRSDAAVKLRQYLLIFERLCETMAYVHVRGVIHRDLKPENVMIGEFGEVQVVDWGMGKALRASGIQSSVMSSDVSQVEVNDRAGSSSIVGSLMGTPGYMAPEMAQGDIERIRETADVFALGAILCQILTGKPPYVGSRAEQIDQAIRGDLDEAFARLGAAGAPREIVELARDCLAPDPLDRPRWAEVVRQRVASFLAEAEDRAQQAQFREEAAEVRTRGMRRLLRLYLGSGLLVAAGLLAAVFFWRQAQSALDEYDLLARDPELREARSAAAALFPAWPEQVAALRAWLAERGRPLAAELPYLETRLQELRAGATADASRDHGFDFPDKRVQFKHDNLSHLVDELSAFADPRHGLVAEVEQRLAWAEVVGKLTVEHYRERWDEARAAVATADGVVASALYAGSPIDLQPLTGLVPIGMNPVTKLWEFYHLRSAWDPADGTDEVHLPVPTFREGGALDVSEGMGLVFVLIPGGKFTMGAQSDDPGAPNHDPWAEAREAPPHRVVLDPYLLSRYEMTQAQWRRLGLGDEPSAYRAGTRPGGGRPITGANPVENVSWMECDELLRQHGLSLPTEAQWECGCRAGSSSVWFTGSAVGSLQGFANVADEAARAGGLTPDVENGIDDGFVLHAPVGSFMANPFGLHDTHGNVWEWCLDTSTHDYGAVQPRAGDGLHDAAADASESVPRVCRGGSYAFRAGEARSAHRYFDSPATRDFNLGLRPVRRLRSE